MSRLTDSQRQFYQHTFDSFPALEQALDPLLVAQEISHQAPPWFPSNVELEGTLGKIYVKPGKHVKVIYHFCSPGDPSRASVNLWIAGEVLLKGTYGTKKDRRGRPKQVLSLWDNQVVLKPFAQDKRLLGIRELSDCNWALDYVRQHASALGVSDPARIESVTVEPFKYVPGKRILFRYRVLGANLNVPFYVKLYQDERGAWSADVQNKVSRLLKAARGTASVPAVYFYDPRHHAMFQEDWGGTGLGTVDSVLDQPGIWRRVLKATHELHSLKDAPLVDSHLDWPVYMEKIAKDTREINSFIPGMEGAMTSALEHLRQHFAETRARYEMFLHGSLNPTQILLQDIRVGFVDFDGATMGDPLYDLSELLAGLIHKAWMRGATWRSLQSFRRAALEDYRTTYQDCGSRERADSFFLMFFLNKTHQRLKELCPMPDKATATLREILEEFS